MGLGTEVDSHSLYPDREDGPSSRDMIYERAIGDKGPGSESFDPLPAHLPIHRGEMTILELHQSPG